MKNYAAIFVDYYTTTCCPIVPLGASVVWDWGETVGAG